MTESERNRSVFAGRQEKIVDPKTGHIILEPEQAKEILFDFLLSDYMKVGGDDAIYNRPRFTEVEVLAQIVKASKGEKIDFTEALEKFRKETGEEFKADQERKYGERGINIIRPTP